MPESILVADSSPLIAFARINQLNLLPKLFSTILVPPEVWDEVTQRGVARPGAQEVGKATWIETRTPDRLAVKSLSILVHRGEAEVIALGCELPNCVLLLDDSKARRVAEKFNIRRIGTLGLLRRAKQLGLLDRVPPLLDMLRESNIYIRKELLDAVLKDVGELGLDGN